MFEPALDFSILERTKGTRLYTADDAAKLGNHKHYCFNRFARERVIPAVKIKGRWRFALETVNWLHRQPCMDQGELGVISTDRYHRWAKIVERIENRESRS